ncbi:hypothetical protein CMV_010493 [Castanea mollissima]|uniref:Uncharacterized protein n=1 Tax=Castanea mollissima TaxID=60419 RepID=A0A8J4R3X1_9ROSI|nr:hypothetical protein CMV_010493 [Castanea mollissima]
MSPPPANHLNPPLSPPPTHSVFAASPQPSLITLNSRAYTDCISLFLFLLHLVADVGSSFFSITLALAWQKAVREWPLFMVHFILWSSFVMSLSAGILLICFQKPATKGIGVCFIAFAIGNGLYACWVTTAIIDCLCKINKSMEGEYVMKEMVKFGGPPDIAICKALTNGYYKEMDINRAELLLGFFAGNFKSSILKVTMHLW